MNCRRGEIFFCDGYTQIDQNGVEQKLRGRPFIVVSPDALLHKSRGALVVPLTTQEKKPLPQHCVIDCLGRKSTALCEQIRYLDESRFGDYYCTVDDEEMAEVEKCLLAAVGISSDILTPKVGTDTLPRDNATIQELERQLRENDVEYTAECTHLRKEIESLQKEIERLKTKENAYLTIIKSL